MAAVRGAPPAGGGRRRPGREAGSRRRGQRTALAAIASAALAALLGAARSGPAAFAGLAAGRAGAPGARPGGGLVLRRAVDLSSMKVAELKALCRERGLEATGRKADLLARLKQEAAPSPAPAPAPAPEPETEPAAEEDKKEDDRPPYGTPLPDPHEGKPEVIVDDEGRKRYLCLDGKYRRGDPESVECTDATLSDWLTEWVVAARTGQLEGKDQMTFFPSEQKPGNPPGKPGGKGKDMHSDDVLRRLPPGRDKKARWEYDGESEQVFEYVGQPRVKDDRMM